MSHPNHLSHLALAAPSADFQIDFLRNLQWLLESSSYNTTYKFALIIALSNLSIESGISDQRSLALSYEQIAEQFITLYWRQTMPFSAEDSSSVLSQTVNRGQIKVINSILELQKNSSSSLLKAQKVNPKAWNRAINQIVRILKDNPIERLQLADQKIERDFLYNFNNDLVTLKPGIAYCFSRFNQIVLKLCQQYWADFVRNNRNNKDLFSDDIDLQGFLFDQPRQNLGALVPILYDIQQGQCFYCHKPLKNHQQVDHFIPWSKYPIDTTHNFVLADNKCNNNKRDYLAEERFYEQWLSRNQRYGGQITNETKSMGFISNQQRSETISSWAYQIAIEHNDLVWTPNSKIKLRPIDPSLLPRLRA